MSFSLNIQSSFSSASPDPSSALLNTLYGHGSSSGGSTINPIQALQNAQRTEKQQIAATSASAAVKTAVAAFTAGVRSATSVKQLLSNPSVMKVLLTANGLQDQIQYTALAKQVLLSNLKDPKSLANTLTDSRWRAMAQTYNFAANGLSAINRPQTMAAIAQGYAQSIWETSQDQVTPGLANALYFISNAGTVTNVDQILGDKALRTVVTTALGIPQQIAFQSLNAQEQAITSRLDISKFRNPHFVQNVAQQYLIANSNSATAAGASTDLTSLAIQATTTPV